MFSNKNKNERKYIDLLRKLAKSDTSIYNKFKVTVYEDEFIEGKENNFIAPSTFLSCPESLINQNSNQISTENTIENYNEQTEIYNKNEIQTLDYPDSSDFSDDE